MPTPDQPYREGIHSRGYLPHVKIAGATYFVTFRLADSLPQAVLARFAEQRDQLAAHTGSQSSERLAALRDEQHREIEALLDRGTGDCHLRHPNVARLVADSLQHFHTQRYTLHAWVVMPNHVHALLTPLGRHALGDIVKSWKQFSALRTKPLLGLTLDRFWQPEAYDRWVRDAAEHERIAQYIHQNPVKACLCEHPSDWPWSSAACPT